MTQEYTVTVTPPKDEERAEHAHEWLVRRLMALQDEYRERWGDT